ncbi:MAG: sugar 3,4-ketoisomerase [Verrucomicrobiales bacterium]
MAPQLVRMVSINDCQFLDLPGISDQRGALTYLDPVSGFPFTPVRVFYLHSLPAGARRAGHAVRDCQQLLVMVAGSCTCEVWDGRESATFHLSDARRGILIPPMIWRELSGFSKDAVCLVLASRAYDESCYIRNKNAFLAAIQSNG